MRSQYGDEAKNRQYGDIWLFEQVAGKTGVRLDFMVAFDGNREMVDAILTLAMFLYITRFSYSRVERWQRIARTPSSMELSPKKITLLTQSITEGHRMTFLQCRASRLHGGQMCAVYSRRPGLRTATRLRTYAGAETRGKASHAAHDGGRCVNP